jgi:hypothetical protein
MIDKLEVLSLSISERYSRLAEEDGQKGFGYQYWIDLRTAEPAIPAILYCRGRYGGINKLSLVGVARLGWRKTRRIIRRVFGKLIRVRIYRVDVCVDVLGKSVRHFLEQCHLSRTQNFRLFRERGATSIYLQWSKARKIVVYDKGWLLRKQRSPLAMGLKHDDQLTRIEIQMRGSGVPFRRLRDISKYQNINLLTNLTFFRFRAKLDRKKPMQFLAQVGLRTLVSEYGIHGTSKMFTAPVWAFLRDKFLRRAPNNEAVELSRRMQKSTQDWLTDRIRSPRVEC